VSERWQWVERTVWTQRMLEALERGVKGGVWFRKREHPLAKQLLSGSWVF
jgi:RNA-directed DNA polymerase